MAYHPKIVESYVTLIRVNRRKLEDVKPESLRAEVKAALDAE